MKSYYLKRKIKTIGKHINNVLKEELDNQVVVAKFATVQNEGTTMQVNSEFVALLKQANTDSSKRAAVIGVSDAQLRFGDYEEKSVNKIFYDNDRRKTGMKSAFRLCFIYNSYKIACQERAGNPPVFLTFFIIPVSVPHT